MLVLLFLVWLIFNGKFTVEIAIFGLVISAVIVLFMCKFMDYSMKKELKLYKSFFWFIKYIAILVWEIIKANLSVISLETSQRYELEPVIVTFKSPVKTSVGKFILANSITLTPGTITVSQENDEFVVHALDSSLAVGLDSSVFVEQILKLEGEGR
ncbi:MAG: Na+/H+ antiporter subunit E [Lachnospiraceae bacterium]|nr:Na+/H+ antiporter subunit E [Lachnospiraceae bacterium]